MNIRELEQRLLEEGCAPRMFAIGSRGSASDAYCLTHNGQEWQVYYTERGTDNTPEFTSTSEEEACDYFFKFMLKFRHDHLVASFTSRAEAEELQAKLKAQGLHPFQNNVPAPVVKETLYRVWVSGKEIFSARKIVSTS